MRHGSLEIRADRAGGSVRKVTLGNSGRFWVDCRKLSVLWRAIKVDTADQGPELAHWKDLTVQIWQMMWAGKFDNRRSDLPKMSEKLARTNVLGLIEKLQRATSGTLQRDYQWLCNAVHPSIGIMLSLEGSDDGPFLQGCMRSNGSRRSACTFNAAKCAMPRQQ